MPREKITRQLLESKERRHTLRQSIIDGKRQADIITDDYDPTDNKKLTRKDLDEQVAREKAAKATTELKKRKAVLVKNILKARPPFNNFVRAVHTGMSPYRPVTQARKIGINNVDKRGLTRKKLNPSAEEKQPPTQEKTGKTAVKISEGVIRFGNSRLPVKQTVFKPPAKVLPLPLMLPKKNVPSKAVALLKKSVTPKAVALPEKNVPSKTVALPRKNVPQKAVALPKKNAPLKAVAEKANAIPKLRTQKTSPKKLIKNYGSETKRPPQQPQVKQVAPKKVPTKILKTENRGANVKPPLKAILTDQKKGFLVDNSNLLRSLQTMAPNNKNVKVARKKNVVPSSTRVLRSSVRHQESSRDNQENEDPVSNAINKSPEPKAIDERSLGLAERKERLNNEIQRLNERIIEWQEVANGSPMPTSIADEIDAVTGQTNLLLTKKFKQFEKLIDEAYSDQRTTLDDLDGFWEMMYIQVVNLDGKYSRLEMMKNSSWQSLTPKPRKRKHKSKKL